MFNQGTASSDPHLSDLQSGPVHRFVSMANVHVTAAARIFPGSPEKEWAMVEYKQFLMYSQRRHQMVQGQEKKLAKQ